MLRLILQVVSIEHLLGLLEVQHIIDSSSSLDDALQENVIFTTENLLPNLSVVKITSIGFHLTN